MNPHILFVIDHLANPDKYTQDELKANSYWATNKSAASTYWSTATAITDTIASNASSAATDDVATDDVEHWVNKYFERSGENKDDYIKELNK